MPLEVRELSILAYANGFTLWHHTTPDVADAVMVGGYFNGASDVLRVGDLVLSNAGPVGAKRSAVLAITEKQGEAVTITAIAPYSAPVTAASPIPTATK